MKITSVKIYPLNIVSSNIKANVHFEIDRVMWIKATIYTGKKGLFVQYGGKKVQARGTWYSNVWFNGDISETKNEFDKEIISHYKKKLKEVGL